MGISSSAAVTIPAASRASFAAGGVGQARVRASGGRRRLGSDETISQGQQARRPRRAPCLLLTKGMAAGNTGRVAAARRSSQQPLNAHTESMLCSTHTHTHPGSDVIRPNALPGWLAPQAPAGAHLGGHTEQVGAHPAKGHAHKDDELCAQGGGADFGRHPRAGMRGTKQREQWQEQLRARLGLRCAWQRPQSGCSCRRGAAQAACKQLWAAVLLRPPAPSCRPCRRPCQWPAGTHSRKGRQQLRGCPGVEHGRLRACRIIACQHWAAATVKVGRTCRP